MLHVDNHPTISTTNEPYPGHEIRRWHVFTITWPCIYYLSKGFRPKVEVKAMGGFGLVRVKVRFRFELGLGLELGLVLGLHTQSHIKL